MTAAAIEIEVSVVPARGLVVLRFPPLANARGEVALDAAEAARLIEMLELGLATLNATSAHRGTA